MGVNNQQSGQPQPYGSQVSPQQALQLQQLKALQGAAVTPYSGSAPGGGAAQGVSQIAAALLARQRQQDMMKQFGNPQAQYQSPTPGVLPGAVAPQGMNQQPVPGGSNA